MNAQKWSTARRDIVLVDFDGRRPECRSVQIEATPQAQHVDVFMAGNDETDGAWQRLTLHLPDGSTVEVRGSDWYWVDVRRPDRSMAGFVSTDLDVALATEARDGLDVERLVRALDDHCHEGASEGLPLLVRHDHLTPYLTTECGAAIAAEYERLGRE